MLDRFFSFFPLPGPSRSGVGRPLHALVALLSTFLGLAVLGGCSGEGAPGGDAASNAATDTTSTGASTVVDPTGKLVLEVVSLDIWAQPLPASVGALSVARDGIAVGYDGFPVSRLPLTGPATYQLELSAADHHPLGLTLRFDEAGVLSAQVDQDPGHGLSLSQHNENDVTVVSLFLGLRHRWFSAQGRPARRGNRIELFHDGDAAWSSTYVALTQAQSSVEVSTWWWESDFELVRDPATHVQASENARRANTVLEVLEQSPAYKRVLVGQLWRQDGLLGTLTVDEGLQAHGTTFGEGFEFMGQANATSGKFWFEPSTFLFGDRVRASQAVDGWLWAEESAVAVNVPGKAVDLTAWPIELDFLHGSMHQKFLVVDGRVAFIGGMNIKATDWDAADHAVFEPRRMYFEATNADREAVQAKERLPDLGPRKDYTLRVEGPAAQDAADVFARRWNQAIDDGVQYAEASTPMEVDRNLAPVEGGLQVQVTTTLPEPYWEHSIAETWFNAVDHAERYIFIEDQYFRAPMLNERILERMAAAPDLKLVVATKPINEWGDPGCAQTYLSHEAFLAAFPGRYLLLQLKSFDHAETSWGIDETDGYFADMDIHSKMLIVDDVFMSVGSANKNNRGMIYEAEMNVAVVDVAFVTQHRRRILQQYVGEGVALSDDVSNWYNQLFQAASHNQGVYAAWEAEGFDLNLNGAPLPAAYAPAGLAYPMAYGSLSDCLFESVGPDLTGAPDGEAIE